MLDSDWRRNKGGDEERRILSLCADDVRAPYSIHSFVNHGAAACGKYPGEWFGPSATARCIQYVKPSNPFSCETCHLFRADNQYRALVNQHEDSLRVYSTGDLPDVYEDAFMETAKPDGQIFHPTLILVGTRLGIDKVNQVYWESLTATLQMPQSVGIAGYVEHLSQTAPACRRRTYASIVAGPLPLITSWEPKDPGRNTTKGPTSSTSTPTTPGPLSLTTRTSASMRLRISTHAIRGASAACTFASWTRAC